MAEENKEEVKEEKEVKEEPKKEENLSAAEEIEDVKERLKASQAKEQRFDAMNERYLKDPDFKKQFDAAWNKQELEKEVAKVNKSIEPSDLSPEDLLRQELDKANRATTALTQKLETLQDVYVKDRLGTEQKEVAIQYEDEFMQMAINAGYDPESEAYDILFTKAEKEGYNIAKELGVNLLQGFNPKIVKRAFERTLDKMKKAGFDDAQQKRQQALKEAKIKQEKVQSDGPGLEQFFTKQRLKERGGAGKAMEEAFNSRFPNRNELKI